MSLMDTVTGQSRSTRMGVPRINSIPTSSGSTRTATAGSQNKFLGEALQLIGGFMGDRSDRRQARDQRRYQREENRLDREQRQLERLSGEQTGRERIMADRASTRETLRTGLQSEQDTYARDIERNRRAIAPWREMYQGPRFTTANPNAPIYNPLMEEGHIFGQLGQPLVPPPGMTTPWTGG